MIICSVGRRNIEVVFQNSHVDVVWMQGVYFNLVPRACDFLRFPPQDRGIAGSGNEIDLFINGQAASFFACIKIYSIYNTT